MKGLLARLAAWWHGHWERHYTRKFHREFDEVLRNGYRRIVTWDGRRVYDHDGNRLVPVEPDLHPRGDIAKVFGHKGR